MAVRSKKSLGKYTNLEILTKGTLCHNFNKRGPSSGRNLHQISQEILIQAVLGIGLGEDEPTEHSAFFSPDLLGLRLPPYGCTPKALWIYASAYRDLSTSNFRT